MAAVLLDLDGTLIDSNEAHARSWMEALADAGIPAEYAQVRSRIGEGGDHFLAQLTGIEAKSDLGRRLIERRAEIFRLDYFPHLRAFPGARALLSLFQARGYRLMVVTSGGRRDTELLLRQTRLDDLLPDFTCGDEASTKPDPDLVNLALGKLGLPPSLAFFLGDTPYDILAASRAGVRAVAFTCGGWTREWLGGAEAIFQGPWELLAAFECSPFASKAVAA